MEGGKKERERESGEGGREGDGRGEMEGGREETERERGWKEDEGGSVLECCAYACSIYMYI